MSAPESPGNERPDPGPVGLSKNLITILREYDEKGFNPSLIDRAKTELRTIEAQRPKRTLDRLVSRLSFGAKKKRHACSIFASCPTASIVPYKRLVQNLTQKIRSFVGVVPR